MERASQPTQDTPFLSAWFCEKPHELETRREQLQDNGQDTLQISEEYHKDQN